MNEFASCPEIGLLKVSGEEIAQRTNSAKDEFLAGSASAEMPLVWYEYQLSIHVLGENSLENAKKLGALDVRELYPDIIPTPIAEFAKKFYSGGDVF